MLFLQDSPNYWDSAHIVVCKHCPRTLKSLPVRISNWDDKHPSLCHKKHSVAKESGKPT